MIQNPRDPVATSINYYLIKSIELSSEDIKKIAEAIELTTDPDIVQEFHYKLLLSQVRWIVSLYKKTIQIVNVLHHANIDRSDIWDCVHMAAYQAILTYDYKKGSLSNWISENVKWNRINLEKDMKRKIEVLLTTIEDEEGDIDRDIFDEFSVHQFKMAISKIRTEEVANMIMDTLKEKSKEANLTKLEIAIFNQYVFDEMTVQQIAIGLKTTETNVYNLLMKAKNKILTYVKKTM